MRAALAYLSAAALSGCGAEAAAPTSVDSHGWLCSTQPAEVPEPRWAIAEAPLDVALPTFELDDHGARGLVAVPAAVVVFTPRARHLVTLDGTVTTATYDPEFPSRTAMLDGVAGDGASFGAIMELEVGAQRELRFCIFDAPDLGSAPRCVLLDGDPIADARLSFDGVQYRAHAVVDAAVHRWRFDDQPRLLDEDDLWATGGLDREVLDVVSTPDDELVITRAAHTDGAGCSTFQAHHQDAAEHRWESLMASELSGIPDRPPAVAASSSGHVAILSAGACIANERGCSDVEGGEFMVSLLTTGTTAESRTQPATLPGNAGAVLFFDGSSLVSLYDAIGNWRLSRFAEDGALERNQVQLGGSLSVGRVTGALAIDRGDYLFVYETGSPRQTRVRRVLVP